MRRRQLVAVVVAFTVVQFVSSPPARGDDSVSRVPMTEWWAQNRGGIEYFKAGDFAAAEKLLEAAESNPEAPPQTKGCQLEARKSSLLTRIPFVNDHYMCPFAPSYPLALMAALNGRWDAFARYYAEASRVYGPGDPEYVELEKARAHADRRWRPATPKIELPPPPEPQTEPLHSREVVIAVLPPPPASTKVPAPIAAPAQAPRWKKMPLPRPPVTPPVVPAPPMEFMASPESSPGSGWWTWVFSGIGVAAASAIVSAIWWWARRRRGSGDGRGSGIGLGIGGDLSADGNVTIVFNGVGVKSATG